MKFLISLMALSLATHCSFAQAPFDNSSREIVFQHVNVIPMDKEVVISNQTVVIKNRKFPQEKVKPTLHQVPISIYLRDQNLLSALSFIQNSG